MASGTCYNDMEDPQTCQLQDSRTHPSFFMQQGNKAHQHLCCKKELHPWYRIQKMCTSHAHTALPTTQNTIAKVHLLPVLHVHNTMTINQLVTIKALFHHHTHLCRMPNDVGHPMPSQVPWATPKYNSQLLYYQNTCHTITNHHFCCIAQIHPAAPLQKTHTMLC